MWCFLTALCRWWWWHYNLQHCESVLSTCWSFHWFQRRLFHHQQITTMQQALFWKFNSSQYREGSLFSCWIKSCEIFLNKQLTCCFLKHISRSKCSHPLIFKILYTLNIFSLLSMTVLHYTPSTIGCCEKVILKKATWKKWSDDELVCMFQQKEEMESLSSSSSHTQAAAGRISWFDPRLEAASYSHIPGCQWGSLSAC